MIKNDDKYIYISDEISNKLQNISMSNATLIIYGETGTGKELIANKIHYSSNRSSKEPVFVNLSAIPDDLLEKELFGSMQGSFTDSKLDYVGKFQQAIGSTIILDEICDTSKLLQSKLLQVLDTKEITPIGSNKIIKIDCRIICLSKKNLKKLVEIGKFREDLYYRLNIINITLPTLNNSMKHFKTIVQSLIKELSLEFGDIYITDNTLQKLSLYSWPGNFRELRNCLERTLTMSNGGEITSEYLLLSSDNNVNITNVTLKDAINNFKKEYIIKVLDSNNWNVTKSAKVLDIQRTYLSRLIKDLYND